MRETAVPAGEFWEDWYAYRHFCGYSRDLYEYLTSDVRREEISDCAEDVFRGMAATQNDKAGNVAVIGISSIKDFEIDCSALGRIREDSPRRLSGYVLKEGGVLIPSRGTSLRVGVFREQAFPCVASLLVVRPDKKRLNGTWLKLFLASDVGKRLILGDTENPDVMNFGDEDLKSLEIPLPPLEEQEARATKYDEGLREFTDAKNK